MGVLFRDKGVLAVSALVALLCAVFIAFTPSVAYAASAVFPEIDFDTKHHTGYEVWLNADAEGVDDKIKAAVDAGAASEPKAEENVVRFFKSDSAFGFDVVFDYFALADVERIESCENWYDDIWCDWFNHSNKDSRIDSTCTVYGYDFSVCQRCGHVEFKPVAPIGHKWSGPVWKWTEDPVSATATFTCGNDETHVKTLEASLSKMTMDDGSVNYVASVTLDVTTYTDNFLVKPPVDPDDPDDPNKPVDPDDPNKPDNPDNPDDPNDDPNKPDNPDNPDDPNKPDKPDGPDDPNRPGTDDPVDDPNKPSDDPSDDPGTTDDPVTDDPTDDDNQTPTDPGKSDPPAVDAIVGSEPVVASIDAGGKASIKVDGVPGEFVISIDGAPEGVKSFSVRKVTAGPVYEALSSTVKDVALGNEIVGVYDIDLIVDGRQKADNFGSLTLEFPVGSDCDNKWATVFHCHNNDTGNISSYDSVLARGGKVSVKGVKNLSAFAVAVGDRAIAKQIGQVNIKTRVTQGVIQPTQITVKRPVMVSESEVLMKSVSVPSADMPTDGDVLSESGTGLPATAGQSDHASLQTAIVCVGVAIAALMTLLIALIVLRSHNRRDL